MKIDKIKENKDGSLSIELDLTEKEKDKIIEYAINDIIKNYLEELEFGLKK